VTIHADRITPISPGDRAGPTAARTSTQLLLLAAAAASIGAAGIHFAVIQEHLAEYTPYGIFFVAVALAQALWAIVVPRYPDRWLLAAGGVANLALVALWALVRTKGLPLGPEPWTPERFSLIDSVSSGLELTLAATVVVLLRHVPRPIARFQLAAAAVVGMLTVATGVALLSVGMPE